MVARSTANTAPHICHHSGGVTSPMYCCCFKRGKRDPTKKQRVIHPSPVWACALDPGSEKCSRLPTCRLPVLLLPLPLFSCLGCIPPFIGLPFLRFYAVVSSVFLLFVLSSFFLSIATMSFAGYFLVRSLLSAFPAYLRTFFRFDLVWFRLSCVHGWIRSGSVNVR